MRIPLPLKIAVTAFAPVFLVLWIIAQAGRFELVPSAILAAAMTVAIAVAPWRPWFAALWASAIPVAELAGILPSFTDHDWPILFGALIPIACAGFALTGRRRQIALAAGVVGVLAFATSLLGILPSDLNAADRLLGRELWYDWIIWSDFGTAGRRLVLAGTYWLFGTILVVAVWGGAAGLSARMLGADDRAARARAEADLAAAHTEQAIVGERARIARDVHDAMAHSLAIVIAQADGALASGAVDDADAALSTIAETARRALGDVREVLERIDGDSPALGARDLPDLIETVRTTGLEVRMSVSGDPEAVPTAVSLAAYRIVQEALTNAIRHTEAAAVADVTIDWRGAGAVIVVASEGVQRSDTAGPGRGIAGMTERARLLGGWLSAGRSGDEFVVTATLPYPAGFTRDSDTLVEARA